MAEQDKPRVVSFDNETLILVDSDDHPIGYLDKDQAHRGQGKLHRAFSIFIFNPQGELLLQQRSPDKRLWGGYWSNSVCSHPRKDENLRQATQRRLLEELGFSCPLEFLYKFKYQATFGTIGSEHELCSVLIGHYAGQVRANPLEIEAWRWLSPTAVDQELARSAAEFTPWFQLEWAEIKRRWPHKLKPNFKESHNG